MSRAADATIPGPFTVAPLDEKLTITAPYSGDDNANNSLLIEWDEEGGDWGSLLGSNLLPHAASPYSYSISGLTNGTIYQIRLRWQDDIPPADQIQTGLTPYNPLIHNSLSTASAKWGGGWGVIGEKYGDFTCTTCHEADSSNIKRIRESISTPDGSSWEGPATASVAIFFSDTRDGNSDFGNDSLGHALSFRICEACHSQNKYHNYNTADNVGGNTEHYNQSDCIRCHQHQNGFKHGGSGSACDTCHGHDAGYEYSPGEFSAGAGTTQSHSTHTENDTDDIKGPLLACADCHNPANFPTFRSKADPNAELTLAQTDICNDCHSPDGPLDGVDDAAFGAKSNWSNGIYSGGTLIAGKKQWCVGCHDSGTSLISGRQAPDVAGNNSSYGYYQSGHGAFLVGCGGCHGLGMDHNFDGQKTYSAANLNYKQGFRLSDVNGNDPLNIPNPADGCNYFDTDYELCFSCHSAQNLLQDTRSLGTYNCTTNPYNQAASILTSFKNINDAGTGDNPSNIHWDHLADINFVIGGNFWDSDGDGTGDSEISCTTCHNPHGTSLADNSPTVRMTERNLDISSGSDVNGDYGLFGWNITYPCAVCHSGNEKYYRTEPPPIAVTPPDTPINTTPTDGATGVLQPPTFIASDFSDADAGDTHQASQWLASSAAGGSFTNNQLYDSGVVAATNSHVASISWGSGNTYYWKVRYRDSRGVWSSYSAETGFTILTNTLPDRPVNVTPAADAVDVSLQPLLSATAFSDADAGDTHQASIWQVSTSNGANFSAGLAYSSGIIAATTSHTVAVPLDAGPTYYWRTSYQDSKGQWSVSSAETAFSTIFLISRFHFDEGSGTITYDAAGNNDGSVRNGAIWTPGFIGSGLLFDGIDDDVIWTYSGGGPKNNFTIEAMVKATAVHEIDVESSSGVEGISGQKYLFEAAFNGSPDSGAGVSLGTNGISVYEHSGGYLPPLAVYNPATKNPVEPQLGTGWNHVAVSYSNKQPRIYVNGKLVHTGLASPMANVFAPSQLANGAYGGFTGTVDEVTIYGKALTEAEILQRCQDLGQCL